MMSEIVTGTVEGTGAAIEIEVGFSPRWAHIFNIDGDAVLFWTADMGDDTGYKFIAAGTNALIASGGVTPSDEDDDFRGLTLGADTDINVDGETLVYEIGR